MRLYSAIYFENGKAEAEDIQLVIAYKGLVLHFDNRENEFWPYADCYAGQVAQGEAECIAHNRKQARLYTSRDIIRAVQAAMKGDDFVVPKRISWGPLLLFGFLALCALIWFFAG